MALSLHGGTTVRFVIVGLAILSVGGALAPIASAGDSLVSSSEYNKRSAPRAVLPESSPAQVAEIYACYDECKESDGLSDLSSRVRDLRCAVSCETALRSPDQSAAITAAGYPNSPSNPYSSYSTSFPEQAQLCAVACVDPDDPSRGAAGAPRFAYCSRTCDSDLERYAALAANPDADIIDRFLTWWKSEETPSTWARWAALGGFDSPTIIDPIPGRYRTGLELAYEDREIEGGILPVRPAGSGTSWSGVGNNYEMEPGTELLPGG